MERYVAHVKQNTDGGWAEHCLGDHLRKVDLLASEMVNSFNSGDWVKAASLWHDLGKFRSASQGYTKKVSGYDPEVYLERPENE